MNRGVEIDSAVADGGAVGDPAAGDVRHRGAHGGDEHHRGRTECASQIQRRSRHRSGKQASTASAIVFIADGKDRRARRGALGWTATRDRRRGARRGPGLVDLSARLREPGFEYKATLESEMEAAVAGGVTSLACPPDTDPPLDEPGLVEMLTRRAQSAQAGARLSGRRADARARRQAPDRDGGARARRAASRSRRPTCRSPTRRCCARAAVRRDVRLSRCGCGRRTRGSRSGGVAHDGEVATRLGLLGNTGVRGNDRARDDCWSWCARPARGCMSAGFPAPPASSWCARRRRRARR